MAAVHVPRGGDDDDPAALAGPHELGKVPGHRLGVVVRHEDARLGGSQRQDLQVARAAQRGVGRRAKVDIRLEADHGYDASDVRRLAASFW